MPHAPCLLRPNPFGGCRRPWPRRTLAAHPIQARASTMTTEQRNKDKVQAFFTALNKADSVAIVDAYAEDGRCVTMGNTLISGSYGKEQIRQYAAGVLQVFPQGIRFTILGMTAEGERV